LLPLSGNGLRQSTVTSTEQHSVQNTKWYSCLQRQSADSVECTMEIVYQTARSNSFVDHNLNRPFSCVTIYSCMIYGLRCFSHSSVSVHWAKYSEFRQQKEATRILESTSQAPPSSSHYRIPIHTFSTTQSSLQSSSNVNCISEMSSH